MKAKFCAMRAFLWSAAYYIVTAILAAYLGANAPLNAWQTALMFLPLIILCGSCEIFFNKRIALRIPQVKTIAAVDCGAKCAGYLFFLLSAPAVISYATGIGVLIAAAIFSFSCEAVLFMKAEKKI